jgi:hypothetical protein
LGADPPHPLPGAPLDVGTRVEVRSRFDGHWTRGFELSAADRAGYRVRRLSDGSELPAVFAPEEVRPERRRQGMWWY